MRHIRSLGLEGHFHMQHSHHVHERPIKTLLQPFECDDILFGLLECLQALDCHRRGLRNSMTGFHLPAEYVNLTLPFVSRIHNPTALCSCWNKVSTTFTPISPKGEDLFCIDRRDKRMRCENMMFAMAVAALPPLAAAKSSGSGSIKDDT